MTAPTNIFATSSAIGNREDLSDMIYRIDPTDTPGVTGFDTTKATAVKHEWQTQALAAATASNFQTEGDDAAGDATTATTRLSNTCQISRKVPIVSGTQQAVEHAGRDDEMAYQEMLKGLELKRDMEQYIMGSNQKQVTTDPRQTASLESWIKSADSHGSGGSAPATADGNATRTDGTQRAFTESLLKSVLNTIWVNGGKPDTIITGAFNKQVFSTFTGRSTPMEQAATKKIVAAVDFYESDFGTMRVVPDRFLRSSGRNVFALQMDMWALAYLNGRKLVSIPLSITGDSIKKELLSEFAFEARNEKASGIVADLTTS